MRSLVDANGSGCVSRRVDEWCRQMQARVMFLDSDQQPLTKSERQRCRYVLVAAAGAEILTVVDPRGSWPFNWPFGPWGARADQHAPLTIGGTPYWFGERSGRTVPIIDGRGDDIGTMTWRGIKTTPVVDVSLRGDGAPPAGVRPDLDALVAGGCDFSGQSQRAQPLWSWFVSNVGP